MSNIESIRQHTLVALEYVGTAAFAVSGVWGAIRKRMDIVGICVCGFLAAFGGGTLRDVLIDRRPFFWVEHQEVLLGILLLCVACATFFKQHHLESSEKLLSIPDALGLGLFCTTGLHLSWSMGQPPAVAIMMGVITGTFGGVLRDIVCNEIPTVFRDQRPYAVCAFVGGWACLGLDQAGWPEWAVILMTLTLTAGLRMLSVFRGWRLPGPQA